MHTVYFTGDFVPVERSVRRLDGVVDAWLRRNPREAGDGMKMADEIKLTFPVDDAPTIEMLQEHIDAWFDADALPKPTADETARLLQIILGVTPNAVL